MTPLLGRLKEIIRMDGPIPVSVFMTLCLHDPEHGYYASSPGIGRDFQTAPEISQIFGELLGLWAVQEWRSMGSPASFWFIEPGPGRGVMMRDMMRASGVVPEFRSAARIALVEASPRLAERQRERLSDYQPTHFRNLSDIPPGPFILIANEFLDCLPIRQFVRSDEGWCERLIGLSANDELIFGRAPIARPDTAGEGAQAHEAAPGLETLIAELSARFAHADGRALLIDYGPATVSPEDTLRAYSQGRQVDPLLAPGDCDLTADVDFPRLIALASAAGLHADGPIPQRDFLLRLGLAQRCARLETAAGDRAQEIRHGAWRLVDASEMGERFQAVCLSPAGADRPSGF